MEWATEWGQVNFYRTGYVEIQLYLEHLAMDHDNIYHHSFCSFRLQLPMIRKSSESAVWISLKKTQKVSSEIRISWTVWGSLVLTAAKWQTHDGWAGNSCCCERRASPYENLWPDWARLWPDSGHNAIFVARTERGKARQGFCLASISGRDICLACLWPTIWLVLAGQRTNRIYSLTPHYRDICQAILSLCLAKFVLQVRKIRTWHLSGLAIGHNLADRRVISHHKVC